MQGTVRPKLPKGDRLVTLFLVNDQMKPEENQDAAWVFQPEIIVRGIENGAVFRRRPVLDTDGHDAEREALEMVYRKRVEFAVGHGVAVHVQTASGDTEKGVEIRTVIMPESEVQVTETPGLDPRDRPAMRRLLDEGFLDMDNLARLPGNEFAAALKILTDDYGQWITEQSARIPGELAGSTNAATDAMARCSGVRIRLEEGIKTLEENEAALSAFRFAQSSDGASAHQEHLLPSSAARRPGDPGGLGYTV